MHRLHRHLARALGVAIVHTGATLTTGTPLSFVPRVDHSQCALLTLGTQPVEALDIERFTGRVRRQLALDPARVRVQTFDFVFRFAKGEQLVTIVMTPGRARGQFHLAMVRRPS